MYKVLYIPNGPKNLQVLFPDVDFSFIENYTTQVTTAIGVAATSTNNVVVNCCEDAIRIHFVNYLGTVDSIQMKLITKEHAATSEEYKKNIAYPLQKPGHALSRYNVKSNDTYTCVTTRYNEEDFNWIDELFDSPLAWIEWKGTQGQPDSYLSIKIIDAKYQKQKEDDRFSYEISLQFILSNDRIIVRN